MIHALLVTRENLWIYEKRSEIDRQLSRELSKDLEMNVFDEWCVSVNVHECWIRCMRACVHACLYVHTCARE